VYVHKASRKENWLAREPAHNHGKLFYEKKSAHELIHEMDSSCRISNKKNSSHELEKLFRR
jgi:hypothetical protein